MSYIADHAQINFHQPVFRCVIPRSRQQKKLFLLFLRDRGDAVQILQIHLHIRILCHAARFLLLGNALFRLCFISLNLDFLFGQIRINQRKLFLIQPRI